MQRTSRLKLLSLAALALAFIRPASGAQNAGAIGQIVPFGGIVAVIGPAGSVVTNVRVHPGDTVKAGGLLLTVWSESS